MTSIKFTAEELAAAQANPLPWWSQNARWANGRVAPGLPAVETDENDNLTGFFVMNHPEIDEWDVYTLDVMRAGWQYAQTQPGDDGQTLIEMQQAADWEEWDRIQYANETGLLDADTTQTRIMGYLLGLGRSLNVADPVDSEGNPLVSSDPIVLSELPARP